MTPVPNTVPTSVLSTLDPAWLVDQGRRVRRAIADGDAALGQGLAHYWEAGRLLAEVRTRLPHGAFGPYVEEEGLHERSARQYMQLYRTHTEAEVRKLPSLRQALLPAGDPAPGPGVEVSADAPHPAPSGSARPVLVLPSEQIELRGDAQVHLESAARYIRMWLAEGDVRQAGLLLSKHRRELMDEDGDDWLRLVTACGLDMGRADALIGKVVVPEEPADRRALESRAGALPEAVVKEGSAMLEIRHNLRLASRNLDKLDTCLHRLRDLTDHDGMAVRSDGPELDAAVAAQARRTSLEACAAANTLARNVDQAKLLAARELEPRELNANLGQRIEHLRLSMPRCTTRAYRERLDRTVQDSWEALIRICRQTEVSGIGGLDDPETAAQTAVWAIRTQARRPLFDAAEARRAAQHYWTARRLQDIARRCGPDSVLHAPYAVVSDGSRIHPWPPAGSEEAA